MSKFDEFAVEKELLKQSFKYKEEIKLLNERWESLRIFLEINLENPLNNPHEESVLEEIFNKMKSLEKGK